MDIQKEWDLFVAHLRTLGVVKIGRNALGIITNLTREGKCSLSYNDIELMWETWQAAKAQAVPEGFVLVPKEPTKAMLDSARDWSIKKYGKAVGNDGSSGCYKAMIEAQENKG
jgi:hypothetical protein